LPRLRLAAMLARLAVCVGPVSFAGAARAHVRRRPSVLRGLRRTFAGTYLLLAGRLALQER